MSYLKVAVLHGHTINGFDTQIKVYSPIDEWYSVSSLELTLHNILLSKSHLNRGQALKIMMNEIFGPIVWFTSWSIGSKISLVRAHMSLILLPMAYSKTQKSSKWYLSD